MPMGVVSDEDFDKEVNNSSIPLGGAPFNPEVLGSITELPKPGRKEGDVEVPEALRKVIGETSVLEGRASALDFAASLGISPASVSAYANGATSTASYNTPNPAISTHIKERKVKVVSTALSRLTRAMNHLSPEKIAESSAKEISGIAKDMAQVVKLMDDTPAAGASDGVRAPQFLVYAPTMIDERKFETIVAKE